MARLRNGQYNFDACVAMAVLATVAVALRFFVRRQLKQSASLSEWFCIAGLIFFYAYDGAILYYIVKLSPNGNGNFDAFQFTDPMQLRPLLRILFIGEMFFSASITAIKISILCFYHQIFVVSTKFRWAVYTTGVICIGWLIGVVLAILLQCKPIHAFWDYISAPQYCNASATVLLGYEVSNLLIDVLILLLPIFVVRTLHLPTWRKASVIGIFLLGGFVCIASTIRVTRIWRPPNTEINIHLPTVIMWSTIQIGAAIICACLPTYGPILKSKRISNVLSSLFGSFRSYNYNMSFNPFGSKNKWSSNSSPRKQPDMSWQSLEDGTYKNPSKATSTTESAIVMDTVPSK